MHVRIWLACLSFGHERRLRRCPSVITGGYKTPELRREKSYFPWKCNQLLWSWWRMKENILSSYLNNYSYCIEYIMDSYKLSITYVGRGHMIFSSHFRPSIYLTSTLLTNSGPGKLCQTNYPTHPGKSDLPPALLDELNFPWLFDGLYVSISKNTKFRRKTIF